MFSYLSRILPDLKSTHESLLTNKKCWQSLDKVLQEEGLPAAGGLDYLRDKELEQKVLQRVEGRPLIERQASPSEAVSSPKKAKKPSEPEPEKQVSALI